jgi:hypothetical protein
MAVEKNVADHYTASTSEHRNIDGGIYAAQIHAVYQHMPSYPETGSLYGDETAGADASRFCRRGLQGNARRAWAAALAAAHNFFLNI